MSLMLASYDGYNYLTNDSIFLEFIISGRTEPYPIDLEIVKKYFNMFPHKNRTYIDIGAHIGTTIMPYSKMFKRIIGYDACKENFDLLQKNLKINNIKNCEVYNNGIFNENCKGNIVLHYNNSGCYYFKKSNDDYGDVQCKKIDDEAIERNIEDVDFIKIDTEGCELYVLQGAEELIKKYKPFIQLESNDLSEKIYGIKENDIINYLKNLGYLPFHLEKNKSSNIFFYHPNDTLSILPKHIYTFWTGTNNLSVNRVQCLEKIKDVSECELKLINSNNLKDYIIPSFPLHPAYQYLSETHKADYLRLYFMHFYGGGFTDIKSPNKSWINSFDKLFYEKNKIATGYPEIDGGVANPNVSKYWNELIGNCCYIFRPNTEFTQKWYNKVNELLDTKLAELIKNPSRFPQDCKEKGNGYPIEWNEMLGRIFHLLNYEYKELINRDIVAPQFDNYR